MDKKFLITFGVINMLVICVGCFLMSDNTIDEEEYERIETGFTPEQTWDIIKGKDVGLVIKEGIDNNG